MDSEGSRNDGKIDDDDAVFFNFPRVHQATYRSVPVIFGPERVRNVSSFRTLELFNSSYSENFRNLRVPTFRNFEISAEEFVAAEFSKIPRHIRELGKFAKYPNTCKLDRAFKFPIVSNSASPFTRQAQINSRQIASVTDASLGVSRTREAY